MMVRTRFLLLSLSLGAALAPATHHRSVRDERSELYAWFDTLGYDAILGGDFVRVDQIYKYDYDPKERIYSSFGFVVEREGDRYKIVSVGLQHARYPDAHWFAPENERIVIEREDLTLWAKSQMHVIRTAKPDSYGSYPGEQPLFFPERFVLSRALESRGHTDLSKSLFESALTDTPRFRRNTSQTPAEQIKSFIGGNALGDLVHNCDDTDIPRATLAKRFAWFVEHFPNDEYVAFANGAAEIYAMMAKEDEEHAKKPTVPLESLLPTERVAELIYRLRDVYGYTFYSKGSPEFFGDWGSELDDRAPSELVRAGFDAVPQLIDAMSDKRYMRGLANMRIPSATIAQVRDVAQQALERIAHRSFYINTSSNLSRPYDEDAHFASMQTLAREWWADVQSRGERDVLIETILSDDWHASDAAERLADAYPEVAVETIEKAIKAAEDDYSAASLVTALGRVGTDRSNAVIRRYMSAGASLNVRLSAAKVVYATDPASAEAAMTAEWVRLDVDGSDVDSCGALAEFLVTSRSVAGVKAFNARLSKSRSIGREAIVNAMRWKSEVVQAGPKGFRDACEEVLVSIALGVKDDPHPEESLDTRSIDNSYVQDEAVRALADVWPGKYAYFDTPSPREQRRLQVYAANVWRRERGVPLLPLPALPAIGQLSRESLQPLITAVLSSSSEQEGEGAQKAILAKGLPALPVVLHQIEHGDPYEPKGDALLAVAKRLSCIVRVVKLNGPSHGSPIAGMLNALKGQVLSTKSLAKILTGVGTDSSKATRQFLLLVTRDSDGCGVTIEASFLDDWEQKENNQVDYSEDVTLGSESIHNSAGASSRPPSYDSSGGWSLMGAVHRALDSGPRDVFKIKYHLTKAR